MQFDKPWKTEAVLLLGAGLMVSLSIGTLITLVLHQFGPDLAAPQKKFFSFIISSVSFQVVGLALTHLFLKEHELTWAEFLGLKGPDLKRAALVALGVIAVALPLTLGLNEFARQFITRWIGAPETQPTMQVLEVSLSLGQRIYFGMTAILMAPVIEETLFRGILYRTIKQRGHPLLALLTSSVLFGVIHANWMTLVPLTFLAVILALLYDKTGNLMAPILAHSFFNTVNFFSFIYREELTRWWERF